MQANRQRRIVKNPERVRVQIGNAAIYWPILIIETIIRTRQHNIHADWYFDVIWQTNSPIWTSHAHQNVLGLRKDKCSKQYGNYMKETLVCNESWQ